MMRSTPSVDRVLDRLPYQLFSELARRAVAERFVRVDRVVLKPAVELAQDTCRVEARIDACVLAFERFDKGLGHTVGLWTLDRRRAQHQADLARQRSGLACSMGRAVV